MPWSLHDDGLVAHRRHIGAAGRAGAHDDRDLGDAVRAHPRLIVEDAAEMLAVRKDLVLVRQVGPAAVDEIDAGQPVLRRDLLRAKMLLDGHRVVGAALHRRVVGKDHHVAPRHTPDPRDRAGRRDVSAVKAVCGEEPDLEKRRAGIEKLLDPVPRQELAALHMPLARRSTAAFERSGSRRLDRLDLPQHRRPVFGEGLRARRNGGGQDRHLGLQRFIG